MNLFYDCVPGFSIGQNNITCRDDCQKQAFFVNQTQLAQFPEVSQQCSIQIQVPITWGVTVNPLGGIESLKDALHKGFDVQYEIDKIYCSECMESEGACGSVEDDGFTFCCHCRDRSYFLVCPNHASMGACSLPLLGPSLGLHYICVSFFCSFVD